MKVGAAIEPNPGECFLERREVDGRTVYDYTKDKVYVCVVYICLLLQVNSV